MKGKGLLGAKSLCRTRPLPSGIYPNQTYNYFRIKNYRVTIGLRKHYCIVSFLLATAHNSESVESERHHHSHARWHSITFCWRLNNYLPCFSSSFFKFSPLFLSSASVTALCLSVFFICLWWATPTPGDHFGGRYIDHHWLHPGGLHHAGLGRLLLHRREPKHGRPTRIARQQQLYGMPKRCKSALCYAITHILLADCSLQ